jgi:hypothetical protein
MGYACAGRLRKREPDKPAPVLYVTGNFWSVWEDVRCQSPL